MNADTAFQNKRLSLLYACYFKWTSASYWRDYNYEELQHAQIEINSF